MTERMSTYGWTKLRKALIDDGTRCVGCRRWHRRHHLELHHILPRSLGGHDIPENLIVLCHPCHMTYEDRAPGWLTVAARIRAHIDSRQNMRDYLELQRTPDGAREFLDRYYPLPEGQETNDAA